MTLRKDKKPGWSVEEIYLVLDDSVDQAHKLFHAEFGVWPADKSIDLEIVKRFEGADQSEPPQSFVALPRHLVLALMLREGFAGRPRGKKPGAAIRLAVHRARKRKAKLIDNGVKPGLAGKQAAEEAIKHLKKRGYRPIAVPRFQRLMESDK